MPKTDVLSQALKVKDKVSIQDVGFRQMTKGTAKDEIDLDKEYQSKKRNITYRTKGKQQLLENQTTRTKRSGAALLKSIKRRMLKGIPGNRNKSY